MATPTPGIWGHDVIRFPCEANTWLLTASPAAGSAVVDVLLAADEAAFEAGSYASICAGAPPTLTSERAAVGDALNTWGTTALVPGNVLVYRLVSASGGLNTITLSIEVRRT